MFLSFGVPAVTGPVELAIAAAVVSLLGVMLAWRPARRAWRKPRLEDARRRFHWQREHLEAKFIQLAQSHTRRGGPCWTDCHFDDDVAYVRNRSTGELSAFVAVGVAGTDTAAHGDVFQDGSLDAVGNLRAATAVFRFDRDHWDTDGRAIFNLSPSETIRFYRHDLEMVDQESADRR